MMLPKDYFTRRKQFSVSLCSVVIVFFGMNISIIQSGAKSISDIVSTPHINNNNISKDTKMYSKISTTPPVTELMSSSNSNSSLLRTNPLFYNNFGGFDTTIPDYNEKKDDFENWTPSLELRRAAPAYLSGFDKQNRPIWVMEWGKTDLRPFARSRKTQEDFFKYLRYICYVGVKSHSIKSTPDHPVKQHVVLFDVEDFKLENILNRKVIEFLLEVMSKSRRYFEKNVAKLVVINVNSVSEVLINLTRPYIGRILDRIEIYGIQKTVWAPHLLKAFPKDQIAEWYGGKKDFKPLYIVG